MSCRLCLCKIEDMLDPEFATPRDKNLMGQIKVLFGIEITADLTLSQVICKYCADRVKSFYGYHQEVLENQKKLLEVVQYEEEDEVIAEIIDFKEEPEDLPEPKIEIEMEPKKVTVRKRESDEERISKFILFNCDLCETVEDVSRYSDWRSHMKVCHDKENPVFTCCDSQIHTKRALLLHVNRNHDPDRPRRFSCAICLKEFRHKAQIRTHMRVHQRHDEDGYHCKKCPEVFYKGNHWQTHQLVHMPHLTIKDIPFPCKKCPREFPTKKDLQWHLRHEHKQTFMCHLCAETFYIKHQLKVHAARVHVPVRERNEKCPKCELVFYTKGNLKDHIKLVHTAPGEYPCDKCDKVLITEYQLQRHKAFTHETDRKYKCSFCEKAFKRIGDLQDHESIHTGIRRHTCPKCDRKYSCKSNMQSHAKRCKGVDIS